MTVLVGFEVLTALLMKTTIFWDITPPVFTLVSCPAYFSTLKMEAIGFSEMSVDSERTTRRYIPEDGTLYDSSFLCFVYISYNN
jgi:hypothetical protein